ncbi:unnamed protein product [Ectocarpus sp. 12 AP-2014]
MVTIVFGGDECTNSNVDCGRGHKRMGCTLTKLEAVSVQTIPYISALVLSIAIISTLRAHRVVPLWSAVGAKQPLCVHKSSLKPRHSQNHEKWRVSRQAPFASGIIYFRNITQSRQRRLMGRATISRQMHVYECYRGQCRFRCVLSKRQSSLSVLGRTQEKTFRTPKPREMHAKH